MLLLSMYTKFCFTKCLQICHAGKKAEDKNLHLMLVELSSRDKRQNEKVSQFFFYKFIKKALFWQQQWLESGWER